MEEKKLGHWTTAVCAIAALLCTAAFSCCLAAEFKKAKAEDMKVDGSLCSLPSSPAFGLGVAAIACLSLAQIVGTSAAATRLCSYQGFGCCNDHDHDHKSDKGSRFTSVGLLLLSWISFGMAVVMLSAASSMNNGQAYGEGWMDGDCYVVKNGVYGGAAALAILTALLTFGFTFSTRPSTAASSVNNSINYNNSSNSPSNNKSRGRSST
uniref:Uncharacterized protein n=1 Tax=Ananas comosus var. bracteatus TaxID=296719 RepID=A0A6V7NJ51_ANACO|nr:unnamed protein product [Ananas comosus var. bracteatus]